MNINEDSNAIIKKSDMNKSDMKNNKQNVA